MNKETRIFIWGLLLLSICGWMLMLSIHSMVTEEWKGLLISWIIFTFSFFGTITGADKIIKTTK